jgi:ATP-binding cassette, subfamily B, bacterial CvaB/MchF/RaxB
MVSVGATGFIICGIVLAGTTFVAGSPIYLKNFLAWKMGGEFLGEEGVILQDKYNNCGPAALQMVFEFYGVPSSIRQIEEGLILSKKGSSMFSLKLLAEKKGLKAEGWKFTLKDLLNTPMPAVLFVHGDHFVVADSVSADGDLFLRDPALGRIKLPQRNIWRIWRGETLVFSP